MPYVDYYVDLINSLYNRSDYFAYFKVNSVDQTDIALWLLCLDL